MPPSICLTLISGRSCGICLPALGVDWPEAIPAEYAPVTWDELRAMADAGIEIGAHTHTHCRLPRVEASRASRMNSMAPRDDSSPKSSARWSACAIRMGRQGLRFQRS